MQKSVKEFAELSMNEQKNKIKKAYIKGETYKAKPDNVYVQLQSMKNKAKMF